MLSRYERETVVTYNDEEPEATVYTCNQSLIRKLDRFCAKNNDFYCVKRDELSATYKLPRKCVSFRLPTIISEETRAKMALRAKERFARKG